MNWLAHLLLSEPNVENRLGNLLADIVKGTARQELNSHLQRGIACHQVIDRFTDSHIVVQRSKERIDSSYRRFAGVLVDVFYDHFLAKNWSQYSSVSLDEFTAEIYESFRAYPGQIPLVVREVISRVAAEDWLGSYRNVSGVENGLLRISRRLSRRRNRNFILTPAINELITHYDALEYDFQEFFPQLFSHVQNWCIA
ncbi:ACP phosphodiesterase [Nostoc sp. T09]|uniref:acyl carrier protein phosphodiesterase n=1 Tax=Nostoc sp. T09 TaxID=1932621 RepID=UPI000A392B01|nr:ACP phosphodiesterase [Nostoc sp. T09]OUL37192.1 ACP phosphodiesterase [Nostoc sp. T09]